MAADAFTRPRHRELGASLPPRLEAKLPQKLVQQHAGVLARYNAARDRERELGQQIEAARREDTAAAERAVSAGKPIPAPTADKLLAELAECQREASAAADVAERLALAKLTAGRPLARQLADEAYQERTRREDEALAALDQARDLFAQAETLAGENSWLRELAYAKPGPYRQSSGISELGRHLQTVRPRIDQEIRESRERYARGIAQFDRERAEREQADQQQAPAA